MDPKKLRKRYMQLVPHLNKAMRHVHTQLADLPPSDFVLETNHKSYPSVKRKMETNKERDPLALSDLVRGRLFFSDQFCLEEVLDILKHLLEPKIKKIEEKSDQAHGLEYHGITHIDLNIDGVNFELQVMPIEFRPYKEFLHQIYDKFRNPKTREKLTDKQREFLRKIHNNLYKTLDTKSQENRKPTRMEED